MEFSSQGGAGIVAFASEVPGKIIPAKLQAGEELICQKDAFLCSDAGVQFDATFTKRLGAGFLGGEGLILMKVKGPGQAFLNVGGEVTKLDLEAGQKVRIDTTCLAMFDSNLEYSVERVKGLKNILWGGEGLFLATVTGPGRVWIQSMPITELAAKLSQYMPSEKRGRAEAAGGLLRTFGRFGR